MHNYAYEEQISPAVAYQINKVNVSFNLIRRDQLMAVALSEWNTAVTAPLLLKVTNLRVTMTTALSCPEVAASYL